MSSSKIFDEFDQPYITTGSHSTYTACSVAFIRLGRTQYEYHLKAFVC